MTVERLGGIRDSADTGSIGTPDRAQGGDQQYAPTPLQRNRRSYVEPSLF